MLRAIRHVDERATLAHLAYITTLDPPRVVRPEPSIFLEFAPIKRRHDTAFSRREAKATRGNLTHARLLDALDTNLAWFGRQSAQALEYWLDVSRFSAWKRERTVEIPWHDDVFRDDLAAYARRGIRHVTTFAAWVDADYARRWGVAPVEAYGEGLRHWRCVDGQPQAVPGQTSRPARRKLRHALLGGAGDMRFRSEHGFSRHNHRRSPRQNSRWRRPE